MKKMIKIFISSLTILAMMLIGTNASASAASQEDDGLTVTERQIDGGGGSNPTVAVDIAGTHTGNRNSSTLSARRVFLIASNSSASSGSLVARAQVRSGLVWATEFSRTIGRGSAASGNSALFSNVHSWRLQLARANAQQSVTGTGTLTSN